MDCIHICKNCTIEHWYGEDIAVLKNDRHFPILMGFDCLDSIIENVKNLTYAINCFDETGKCYFYKNCRNITQAFNVALNPKKKLTPIKVSKLKMLIPRIYNASNLFNVSGEIAEVLTIVTGTPHKVLKIENNDFLPYLKFIYNCETFTEAKINYNTLIYEGDEIRTELKSIIIRNPVLKDQ